MNSSLFPVLLTLIPMKQLLELAVVVLRQIIDATPTELDDKVFEPVLTRLQEMLKDH